MKKRRKNRPRRRSLPEELHDREHLMREAMRYLQDRFPSGTGLTLLAYDLGSGKERGHMSYISNTQRRDMVRAMREQLERFEMGTEDTAGKEV